MDNLEYNNEDLLEIVHFKDIITNVPIGFCITNNEGIFEFVNDAYCKIYAYQKEELIGEHFSIVTTAENTEELIELHDKFLNEGQELNEEWTVKNKFGEELIISANAAKITGKDGEAKKVTYVLDITEHKALERKLKKANLKLQEKALKDDLTGLYNYGEIMKRLKAEINRSSHIGSPLTIMMLDIDNFRKVNNNYGHVLGDKVLSEMASKIKDNIREMDIAGRHGGDEFLIIFPDTELEDAKYIADRLLKIMRDSKIAGIEITFSGGLYQYKGEKANELVEKADNLMYRAKKNEKNEIVL